MVTRTRAALSSVQYEPGPVPATAADLSRFLNDELQKIAAAFRLLAAGHVDPSYSAPDKPSAGDIRYAVAPWDPGAGDGIYFYNSGGQWVKLG